MLGKKNIVATLFAVALCTLCYSQSKTISGTVGDISLFKQVKENESNLDRYSPNDLYRSYSENAIRHEQWAKSSVFKIYGTVSRVRRGFFDEYIVELECSESWFININVVYPKNISQAKINDIANLNKGQKFEAIVYGEEIWSYVHVLYYNQNGVARTEL